MLRSSIDAGVALVRTVYCVAPNFAVPDGSVRFCVLTAIDDVERRQPPGEQLVGVDIDHDLTIFTSRRRRQGHAGNGGQFLPNAIDAEIIELLFVQIVRIETELQDWNAGGIELHDDRRLDARRHQGADGVRRRNDLRNGKVEIDVRLEVDLLDRQTIEGLRFHVLDAVDVGADGILAVGGDALLHFRRGEAGVLPNQRHHGDANLWKDIRRHRPDRGEAEKQNQRRHHIECVRKPQCKSNDAHDLSRQSNPHWTALRKQRLIETSSSRHGRPHHQAAPRALPRR